MCLIIIMGGIFTAKLKSKFLERTRDEWESAFADLDACVTPILELEEAREFPHNKERGAFKQSARGKWDPVIKEKCFNAF